MNALYNELLATLNTHGPQQLEERLVRLDTATMRTLLADMRITLEGSPRDQLRQHFIDPTPPRTWGERTWGERPWGAATSSSEIFQLIGGDTLYDINRDQQLQLIQFYRLIAHHTGPTALNKAIIAMAVKNAKDNVALSPNTKMVRDMDLVEALAALRSADPAINRNFPANHTLTANCIYKKGSHPTNIGVLHLDRMAGMVITANLASWSTATADFHRWVFLYKRDPSVQPLTELQVKMRGMTLDIGAYIPNPAISSGLGLSKIESHSLDEFNGRIIADTRDGPVAMQDPQFLYRPKFQHEEVVKAVRDRETKRKLLPAYRCRALNQPMKIDRIKLYSGMIHYDTTSHGEQITSDGRSRPLAIRAINGVPEELLIKAGRTKAFGSI